MGLRPTPLHENRGRARRFSEQSQSTPYAVLRRMAQDLASDCVVDPPRTLQQSRNSVPYAELRMALSHSTPTIATRARTGGKRACGLELEMTLRHRVFISYAPVRRMILLADDGTSLAQLVSSEGGAPFFGFQRHPCEATDVVLRDVHRLRVCDRPTRSRSPRPRNPDSPYSRLGGMAGAQAFRGRRKTEPPGNPTGSPSGAMTPSCTGLWQQLLGQPVSESGRLPRANEANGRGDRRRKGARAGYAQQEEAT